MRVAWVIVLAVGCVTDGLVPCGDVLCKVGSVCTAIGCTSPDQLAACAGAADGTACNSDGIDGVCTSGVCDLIICGDGRVVGPEQCDDGNQRANDGCSADCLSNETCGNGVVDGIKGEQCDDGLYGLSGDGCSGLCKSELDSWSDVESIPPGARYGAALAYDSRRARVVMFGGIGGVALDETWEWDGLSWRHLTPLTVPPRRTDHALAYDPDRGTTVLVGGSLAQPGPTADTWEWDGFDWQQRTPAVAPPFGICALAYDAHDHVSVLVTNTMPVQTWTWDGTSWVNRSSTIAPSTFGLLAFDAESQRVILFTSSLSITETWAWDGAAWSNVTSALANAQPTPRLSAAMTATADGHVVLFGGLAGATPQADEWSWAGGRWTQLGEPVPTARRWAAMARDVTGNAVLFGGLAQQAVGDTWVRTGTGWTLVPTATPFPRGSAAWVYQPTRGTTLLYGGGPPTAADTWEWDGLTWTQRAGGPGPRSNARMVAIGNNVLLFGGSTSAIGETWQWDGTSWTKLAPAHAPQERVAHRLAYDAHRDRVVMFGGRLTTAAPVLDETWEWDGTDWTLMNPVHRPPARMDELLVYDERHGYVLMANGVVNGMMPYNDTWIWDGTDWTQLAPPTSLPTGRFFAGVYDPLRRSVFGYRTDVFASTNDLWEWDGTTWTRFDSAVPPPFTLTDSAIYDTVHSRFVAFDFSAANAHAMWAHRFVGPAGAPDRCIDFDTDGDGLVGCADPDCWGRCAPLCPPRTSCDPSAPHCGDGACSQLEDHRLCPADCP